MNSIEEVERRVQDVHVRLKSLWKGGAVAVATGTGVNAAVQGVVLSNWEQFAPLAEGSSIGLGVVAFGASVVAFGVSAWLVAAGGVFGQTKKALTSAEVERTPRGQAYRARRARKPRSM